MDYGIVVDIEAVCGHLFAPASMETFALGVEALLQKTRSSPPTQLTKPLEIGFYSIDEHRKLSLDRSQLVPLSLGRWCRVTCFDRCGITRVRRFCSWVT